MPRGRSLVYVTSVYKRERDPSFLPCVVRWSQSIGAGALGPLPVGTTHCRSHWCQNDTRQTRGAAGRESEWRHEWLGLYRRRQTLQQKVLWEKQCVYRFKNKRVVNRSFFQNQLNKAQTPNTRLYYYAGLIPINMLVVGGMWFWLEVQRVYYLKLLKFTRKLPEFYHMTTLFGKFRLSSQVYLWPSKTILI